ncbi:hypothetical protein BSLG_001402 [Batrachochytrium salamandrivorans]|nr:hypothetical protein BSLG_001402 [Batrachochytrium salamandrivorans]
MFQRMLASARCSQKMAMSASLLKRVPLCSFSAKASIPLTASRLPHIVRNPLFKKLDANDMAALKTILPYENGVIGPDDPDALAVFNEDWMHKFKGQSQLVLRPKTSAQVSQILKYCYEHSIAVVPQGGNTGLVGGGVPIHDEVIVSTQALNQIRSFDDVSGVLTCEAGCILEALSDMVSEKGFIMPYDLGAKGSCQIGGNVATNAGGLRMLRYGSLHGNVLSLEVVLPDGTLVNLGQPLRKDNSGYDMKQIFIGSEGTLGIITAVSILTPPKPKAVNVALLGMSSYEDVQQLFKYARANLSEILSAFEFFDHQCVSLVTKHIAAARIPFESTTPFYVLIETSGSNGDHDNEKLTSFLEQSMGSGLVVDGAVAQDSTQLAAFWTIRESIPMACGMEGSTYKYDLSAPLTKLYDLATHMRSHLTSTGLYGGKPSKHGQHTIKEVVGFGHVGDGNIHLNVVCSGYSPEIEAAIEPHVYDLTRAAEGSISAEHGMGLTKAEYLEHTKSAGAIKLMRQLKTLYDPKGIMNPYKYLPTDHKE